jgi:plastocyanin
MPKILLKNYQPVLAAAFLLLAITLAGCSLSKQTTNTEPVPAAPQTSATPANIVAFRLTAENYKFLKDGEAAPTLRVKSGDRVRVELTVTAGFHDFKIDEFNAATKRLNAGQTDTVEFTANQTGEFEYYCSVMNHRAMGMVGKLIVE